jgi:hypothetical protein
MTENTNPETPSMDSPAYREELISRAQLMGISFHPSAKNETIAAKIAAKLADKPDPEAPEAGTTEDSKPSLESEPVVKPLSKQEKELHPAKRLTRVLVSCNDPQKADQTGDIVSVGNGEIGHIRFYVHFNKPWHVPQIVLDTLYEAKLFLHSSRKEGTEIVTREVPRYNIQVLPPLDEKGRERIAAKQAAALATED